MSTNLFIDGYNANLLNTKMEYNLKQLMLIMSSQVPKNMPLEEIVSLLVRKKY
jgi:hypothetical protein